MFEPNPIDRNRFLREVSNFSLKFDLLLIGFGLFLVTSLIVMTSASDTRDVVWIAFLGVALLAGCADMLRPKLKGGSG